MRLLLAVMDSPPEHDVAPAEDDEVADAQELLNRQNGEQTPVECGYCNRSFPFRTTRLLLAEDFADTPVTEERYIFLCESCWWEVIGNPREEALRMEITPEELEHAHAAEPGGGLDVLSVVADLKRREEHEEAQG